MHTRSGQSASEQDVAEWADKKFSTLKQLNDTKKFKVFSDVTALWFL